MNGRESFEEIIRRGREEIKAWKADVARFRATRQARWEALAGSLLPAMLAKQEAAIELLRHSEARVREGAINVLLGHWKVSGPEFANKFGRMAADDADAKVRGTALVAMSECMRGQRRSRNWAATGLNRTR